MKLDELEGVMKQALAEGALAAEVGLNRSEETSVSRKSREEPKVTAKLTEVLTVRVWVKGGRVGVMSGAPDRASEWVGQALASTFESAEDSHAGPAERYNVPSLGLGIRDRRHDRIDNDARIGVVSDLVNQVGSQRKFTLSEVRYVDKLATRAFVNSRGVQHEESTTWYEVDARLRGQDLDLHGRNASRSFATIASLPLGTQLLRRAGALTKAGKTIPAGPVRVVLPPLPVSRLLFAIADGFSQARLDGSDFFLAADGSTPLSQKLHVVDDGALPGGLRSRGFDDRGVPSVPLTLLKEGRIGGRFLTVESARALGTRPTGHWMQEGLRPTNLVMREGTRSVNAHLTLLPGLSLKIDDFPDLSGLNLATGSFKAVVNGVVMDSNKPVGAMTGVEVSGNLRDLFGQIVEVCNDTDRIGPIDAAAVIADGLVLSC